MRALSVVLVLAAVVPAIADPKGSATIKIAGGKLKMGTDDKSVGANGAYPAHEVTVASFEIDKNLITVADYQACVDAKGCTAPDPKQIRNGKPCNFGKQDKSKHPMNCMTFDNAKAFCAWAGKRLPTEEEWELAARGTEARGYPWGNDEPTKTTRACWGRRSGNAGSDKDPGTCEVGSFPDGNTPEGLQDMAGNVREWTTGEHKDANSPNSVSHVVKGGSWASFTSVNLNGYSRPPKSDSAVDPEIGARCAR